MEWYRGWLGNISSSKFSNRRWLQSYIRWLEEQDKVNYAVSEMEVRVTDLTTITRMTGCAWMYWAATGLYWAVLGCTGLYWTALGCTGL